MKIQSLIALLILTTTLLFAKDKTYVVVVFDVEDYITPESEGIDNIPKWLAEIMTEEGVTGTFFVIGEKARSFEKRGRTDVIAAMASHDIGSHTNMGSIHPTVTEILENADWQTGYEAMLKNESIGFNELERIFNVPVSALARHGGSYGPQLVRALGEMGKAYIYSPIHLENKNATWFCNTLNFHGEYGGFDNTYYNDELFEPALASLKERFDNDIQNKDVVSFFACHPCKVRSEQFWDFNFYEGANPPASEWKAPELRPRETMKTAQENFRRLMQYVKSHDYVEFATYRDLIQKFSWQKQEITQDELSAIAKEILAKQEVVINDYFTPAEIFTALAQSLSLYKINNSLALTMQRQDVFGPLQMPIEAPAIENISLEQALLLAGQASAYINEYNALPAALTADNSIIGTGSLLQLFSTVYLDVLTNNPKQVYPVVAFDPYPVENEKAIIKEVMDFKHWIVHRPDLDMTNLAEMTKMQLWTVKPALEQPL